MSVHQSPSRHSARLQNAYEDGTDEDEQPLLHPADRYDRRRSDCGRPSSPQDQHPRHTQLHASSRMFADPQHAAYDVPTGPFSNAPRPAHTAGEGISGTAHADPAHTCREAALPPSALPSYQSHTRTSGAPGRCNTASWDTPRLQTPSVHRSRDLANDRLTPPPGFYYSDSPYPEPARREGRLRPVSPRRIPSASTSQPAYAASHAEHQHYPQQRTVTTFDTGGGRGLYSSPSEPIDRVADLERKSAFYRNADPFTPSSFPLPPLDLPKFDGDVRKYPQFREAFDMAIGNSDLCAEYKLLYLREYLRGEPLEFAERYMVTERNYTNVINGLDDEYSKHRFRETLCQDLVDIRPPSEDAHDLRRFHRQVDVIQTSLRFIGQTLDGDILAATALAKKLPKTVRLNLVRSYGYSSNSYDTTALLASLKKYCADAEWSDRADRLFEELPDQAPTRHSVAVDTSELSCPHRRQEPEWTPHDPAEYVPRAAAAVATTNAEKQLSERRTCPLCALLHSAADCTVYDTTNKRLRRALKLNLCLLCLREGHRAVSCPRRTTRPCHICRHGQHNRALCKDADDDKHRRDRRPSPCSCETALPNRRAIRHPRRHVLRGNRYNNASVGYAEQPERCSGNLINRKKMPKEQGTAPRGRLGTNRPPTTSTDESMKQKGADAYGGDRLLSGRYHPLQTDKCSTNREMMQLNRQQCDGSGGAPGSMPDEKLSRELYNDEDVPHQPFDGHGTDAVPYWSPHAPDEDRFPPYEENTAYVACASVSDEQPAVLHECLAVTAVNPASNKSCRAVIMFDSGSSSSHVSPKLARDLNLPHGEMRVQNVCTFGSKTPMAVNGFRTFLVLCSEHGRCLHVHVTALDYIVSSVRTALVRDADLLALRRNDCTPTPTREMPDLLIGQDLMHLFDRRLEPTLPSGFYIVQTSMGPTIGGASRRVTPPPKANTSSSPHAALPTAEDADIAEDSSRCSLPSPPSTPDSPISRHRLRLPELSAYRPAHSAGGTAVSAPETYAYRPAHSAGDTAVHDTNECLEPSTSSPFTTRQPSPLPQVHGVLPRSSQKQLSSNPLDTQLLLLPTYSTIHVDAKEATQVHHSAGFLRPVQEPLSSQEAAHRRSPPPTPTRGNQICAALRNARSPLKRKTRLRCRLPKHARQTLGIYTARKPVIAVVSLHPSETLPFHLLRAEQRHQLVLMSSQPPQITIILRIIFIQPQIYAVLLRDSCAAVPYGQLRPASQKPAFTQRPHTFGRFGSRRDFLRWLRSLRSLLTHARKICDWRPLDSTHQQSVKRTLPVRKAVSARLAAQRMLDPAASSSTNGPQQQQRPAHTAGAVQSPAHPAGSALPPFGNRLPPSGVETIQPGELVLASEKDMSRSDWRLALVLELLPHSDGLCRSARISYAKTKRETNRAQEHLYPSGKIPHSTTACSTVSRLGIYLSVLLSDIVSMSDASSTSSTTATTPATLNSTGTISSATFDSSGQIVLADLTPPAADTQPSQLATGPAHTAGRSGSVLEATDVSGPAHTAGQNYPEPKPADEESPVSLSSCTGLLYHPLDTKLEHRRQLMVAMKKQMRIPNVLHREAAELPTDRSYARLKAEMMRRLVTPSFLPEAPRADLVDQKLPARRRSPTGADFVSFTHCQATRATQEPLEPLAVAPALFSASLLHCAFCGQLHLPQGCDVYRTIAQRLGRTRQLGLCFTCLHQGHQSSCCSEKTTTTCNLCRNGQHHEVFYRKVVPADAAPTEPTMRSAPCRAQRISAPTADAPVAKQASRRTPNGPASIKMRRTCAFCQSSHWSEKCAVYDTITQRLNRVRNLKLCFICLRDGHHANNCPSSNAKPCKFCAAGTHHRALCRRCVTSQTNNVHVSAIRQGKKRVKIARVRIDHRNACPPKNETICFSDGFTFHQFGRQLRPGVQMIETPTHTSADAASFVCSFRPTSEVKRVIFWFSSDPVSRRHSELVRLVTELSNYYTMHYETILQYVVVSPSASSRQDVWTYGIFKYLVQAKVLLLDARLTMLPHDLLDRYADDHHAIDSEVPSPYCHQRIGRPASSIAVEEVKRYMREQHQLDLWSHYKADTQLKVPPTTLDAGPASANATRTLTAKVRRAQKHAQSSGPRRRCSSARAPPPTSATIADQNTSSRTLTPCAPSELHLRSRSRHSPRPRPSLTPTPLLLEQPTSIASKDPRTAADVAVIKDTFLTPTTSKPGPSAPRRPPNKDRERNQGTTL